VDKTTARKELEELKTQFDQMADALTETFYAAIGRGITQWSTVEGSLVRIATWLLDSEYNKVGLVL